MTAGTYSIRLWLTADQAWSVAEMLRRLLGSKKFDSKPGTKQSDRA